MNNIRQKLIEILESLEINYQQCTEVYMKEIARGKEESEDVKDILINFKELINNIKDLKDGSN